VSVFPNAASDGKRATGLRYRRDGREEAAEASRDVMTQAPHRM
jgi:hypothetical protein